MASLYSLESYKKRQPRITFSRFELRQIFDVYSRRVATGEWRDYAIDHAPDHVAFSIFRHTAESPVLVVEKSKPGRGNRGYRLVRSRRDLAHVKTIGEIVAVIERQPGLVKS